MGTERANSVCQRMERLALRGGGRLVLAVDDSKSMLLFYQSVVSGLGCEIRTAGSGQEPWTPWPKAAASS